MRRPASSTIAGLAALSAVAAGLAAVPTASAAPSAMRLDWGGCKDKDLRKAQAQCATLVVPLDHDRPDGKKIRLAVSRVKATAKASEYQGLLVGEYVQSVLPDDKVPQKIMGTYDQIGIDPRGTGDSRPLLTCGVNPWRQPQPAYNPSVGPADPLGPNERAWPARIDRFVRACDGKYGNALTHYTSTDSARDVEAGAQDGVRRYFSWVARHDDVYGLGATTDAISRLYDKQERLLTAHPRGEVGPGEWNDLFYRLAFDETVWAEFTSALSKWVHGNRKPLLKFRDDGQTPAQFTAAVAGFLAYTCSEGDWPTGYDQWRKDAFEVAKTAPFSAWADTWYQMACRTWPVHNPAPVVGSPAAPPMLLLAAADDGAFYQGTLELRRRFPKAVLVSVPGSLTAPTFTGNTCIDKAVLRYLRDGTLPARKAGDRADATCKAAPKPKPLKADVKAAKARN